MTKKGDPNPVVMLNSFQHLVKIFSAFGRHTFHPRPQDGVFRCDLNKILKIFILPSGKLVSENDRVRVLDINIKPGGKAAMHSHPGYVAIALDKKCKVKFTSPDGKEEQAEFKAGDTIWREAESHSVQNIGSTECHVLNIELKESAKIS